ncbi:MAG: DUF1223 domain-containing protein [Betaproteobacteria bacterium]|jgi:hypothetical protein|nr:DUF1223 domain-containing protein [Betaproteobacteria bacterium]
MAQHWRTAVKSCVDRQAHPHAGVNGVLRVMHARGRTGWPTVVFAAAAALAAALGGSATALHAASTPGRCSAESGSQRVAVLELYTSQGCSSCPPADRFVSALPAKGFGTDRLIILAMHVDYWNRLGWRDPFSQKAFTERQREISSRQRTGYVYTPQLVLDGRDYRPRQWFDELTSRVGEVNRMPAQARIAIEAARGADGLQVRADARLASPAAGIAAAARSGALRLVVGVYENGIMTTVRSGENAGSSLRNDFIVRTLATPAALGAAGESARGELTLPLASGAATDRQVAFAFVQNATTGEVLQAVALPVCSG